MTPEELKEMARQLSKPTGANGLEVGELMNDVNIEMTLHAIEQLQLQKEDVVLELGHGNCAHLDQLLQRAKNITYTGLEISETMHHEARRINREQEENRRAAFHLYDGDVLPFPNRSFDKAFTVNTIYFWENPARLLNDIHRVLKPGGVLCITFGLESFMQQLPFIQYGFALYSPKKMEQLVDATPFRSIEITPGFDIVESKTGETVKRAFATARLRV